MSKKLKITAWTGAGLGIGSLVIFFVATVFSLVNLDTISKEVSNNGIVNTVFTTAVVIMSIAIVMQFAAIILGVISAICMRKEKRKLNTEEIDNL